jgi:hypothetical protein
VWRTYSIPLKRKGLETRPKLSPILESWMRTRDAVLLTVLLHDMLLYSIRNPHLQSRYTAICSSSQPFLLLIYPEKCCEPFAAGNPSLPKVLYFKVWTLSSDCQLVAGFGAPHPNRITPSTSIGDINSRYESPKCVKRRMEVFVALTIKVLCASS